MSVDKFIEQNIEIFCKRFQLIVNEGSLQIYECNSGFHGLLVHKQTGIIDSGYINHDEYRAHIYGKIDGKIITICDACTSYFPKDFVEKIKALKKPKTL